MNRILKNRNNFNKWDKKFFLYEYFFKYINLHTFYSNFIINRYILINLNK